MTRLWDTTPEKLSFVGPSTSPSPRGSGNSMADALDEMLTTPSKRRSISPSSPASYDSLQRKITNNRYSNLPSHNKSSYLANTQQVKRTPSVALKGLSLGDYPVRSNQAIVPVNEDQDMMDWTPLQSQSKHRAFNSVRPSEPGTQLFGQAPVKPESNTMWFHVPPAPITPAHRLRNPPNQPRLRVSSQEVKENFFRRVTRPSNEPGPGPSTEAGGEPVVGAGRSGRDIEFSQQKFFPPVPPSESGEKLAELMTSFSLGSDPEPPEVVAAVGYNLRHVCQAFALLLGLLFWNRVLYEPSEHTKNATLAVMSGCGLIGARTILDNLQCSPRGLARDAGAVLGAVEVVAAGYGVQEILAGRVGSEYSAPLGSLFIGVMAVYEMLHL